MQRTATTPIEPAPGFSSPSPTLLPDLRADPRAALSRKVQDLEQFAYLAAHDLQEPLRMVAGYLQLLAERYGRTLDPAAGEFLGFALEGSRRMQDLVDALLVLACGNPNADPRRKTSSAEAVSVALANLRLAIEESHAAIRLGNLPEVLADPAQLVRLFQNLIGNAIRHRSRRPPEISVEGEERPRDWLFRVTDNGRGFTQPPAPGLGLEICRRIVERHGGRLWVGSPGGGAVFHFTLARS
jgi:light-regulated signal transduction histidine kinase (bacteriophytochrome)